MNNKKKRSSLCFYCFNLRGFTNLVGLCFNLFLFIVCQAISEINLIYCE